MYIENKDIKSVSIYKIMAFTLGFLVCNNIIYLFKLGPLYINASIIYSIICIIYISMTDKLKIYRSYKIINKFIIYYFIAIISSTIIAYIVFYNNLQLYSRCISGIINFLINITPYILVIILNSEKYQIIKGICTGYIINILISLISYITFKAGNVFTLSDYFPQPYFHVSLYQFRSQGLFLEPSYFMAFLIATILIFSYCYKPVSIKNFVLILTTIIVGLSISGNITILVMVLILYLILSIKKIKLFNNMSIKKILSINASLIVLMFILLLSSNYIKIFIDNLDIYDKIVQGITDSLDIFNVSSTNERNISMNITLDLIPRYLLGVGYNMSHSILELTSNNLNAYSSFNFILTNQIELGIVGTFIYFAFIKQLSLDLIMNRKNNYNIIIGISVIGCFMTQIGNGIRFMPFMWVIFGLASIERFNLVKNDRYLYNKKKKGV